MDIVSVVHVDKTSVDMLFPIFRPWPWVTTTPLNWLYGTEKAAHTKQAAEPMGTVESLKDCSISGMELWTNSQDGDLIQNCDIELGGLRFMCVGFVFSWSQCKAMQACTFHEFVLLYKSTFEWLSDILIHIKDRQMLPFGYSWDSCIATETDISAHWFPFRFLPGCPSPYTFQCVCVYVCVCVWERERFYIFVSFYPTLGFLQWLNAHIGVLL